jgi:hypothetical protein
MGEGRGGLVMGCLLASLMEGYHRRFASIEAGLSRLITECPSIKMHEAFAFQSWHSEKVTCIA